MVKHLGVLDLNPLDPQMVNKIKSSLTETQPHSFLKEELNEDQFQHFPFII